MRRKFGKNAGFQRWIGERVEREWEVHKGFNQNGALKKRFVELLKRSRQETHPINAVVGDTAETILHNNLKLPTLQSPDGLMCIGCLLVARMSGAEEKRKVKSQRLGVLNKKKKSSGEFSP